LGVVKSGLVTNGAAERLVIPEEFFALLPRRWCRLSEKSRGGALSAQEAREGLHIIAERVVLVV